MSQINIGSLEVDKFCLGNSDNVKIYLGDTLLYPNSYKLVAQYSDSSEYKVVCNGSTALTASEVSGHTTPISAMTSAVISDCVKKIDYNAFNGATSLSSITIDDGVTTLGQQAFYGCAGLTSFNFPSGLTTIEGACFRFANRITNLNIPNGVTTLGSGCFADMSGLSAATIPSSVTSVSSNLFLRDTALKEVHFQSTTAPTLGADAFKNCTSLEKIYIPTCDSYDSYAANSAFSAYTDLIYSENSEKCLQNYKLVAQYSDLTEYKVVCNESSTLSSAETRGHSSAYNTMTSAVIGDCVTEIGYCGMQGLTALTSVTIPTSVTSIGESAFHNDISLTHIDLPSGITSISDSSFRHMQSLTAFTIPTGITTIPNMCFNDCTSLSSITIPSNITSLSTNCFSYCTALKEVHFLGTTPPTIASNAFNGSTNIEKIYIPSCDSYDAYAAQAGISAKTDLIYSESNTKCKPSYNFKLKRYFINNVNDEIACDSTSAITTNIVRTGKTMSVLSSTTSGLCEVIIGDCVEGISASSFDKMSKLSAVTISDNVKHIGASAFTISNVGSNNRLHDIDLGNGVQTISQYAFQYAGYVYGSNYITEIKIPKSVTYIGNRAFAQAKMKKLVLNTTTATTIDKYAFYLSTGNSISIDFVVGTLGEYAFNGFSGLTNVKVSGVTTLNTNGRQFANCGNLQAIEVYGTNLTIPQYFVGGNSLTSVTLSGISSISNAYGLNTGASNASTRVLKMLDTTPPTIGDTSISNYNPTVIYVPASAVNAYKAASNWYNYRTKIQAIPNS